MKVIKYSENKPTSGSSSTIYYSGVGGGGSALPDWFYYDGANVHCRYNFVGDLEVSAYAGNTSTDKLQLVIDALADVTANSTTAEIAQILINVRDALTQ